MASGSGTTPGGTSTGTAPARCRRRSRAPSTRSRDTWQARDSPHQGHRGEISAIHVDPDGERVFTAGRDGNARVWSAGTADAVGVPLKGHGGAIRALAFEPANQSVVTAGTDGRLIARSLDPSRWVTEGCRLVGVFGRGFSEAEIRELNLGPDSPGPCPKRDPSP